MLADKNSSHPSHVQFGSILRMASLQAHFSKWHNFSSAVLAPESTIRRSPCFLHLEIVYNPCTVPTHPRPSARVQVQFLFRISLKRLHEMLDAVPETSNSLVLDALTSLASPFWRCSHNQTCGLTLFDQSVCNIKSAWFSALTKPNGSI